MTNFTEEIKEDELRKRGKAKQAGKELGTITNFEDQNDDEDEEEDIAEEENEEAQMMNG